MADFETYINKLPGLTRLLGLVILAYQPVVYAELYKWVDKDGHVNYTQSPPPAGVKSTTIQPPPVVRAEMANEHLQKRIETVKTMTEQRQKQIDAKLKSDQDLAGQKLLCDQARSRLASYERPRVSVSDADGNSRLLGEDERLREVEKARGQVKELCK